MSTLYEERMDLKARLQKEQKDVSFVIENTICRSESCKKLLSLHLNLLELSVCLLLHY